jgi:hypothetical protein
MFFKKNPKLIICVCNKTFFLENTTIKQKIKQKSQILHIKHNFGMFWNISSVFIVIVHCLIAYQLNTLLVMIL